MASGNSGFPISECVATLHGWVGQDHGAAGVGSLGFKATSTLNDFKQLPLLSGPYSSLLNNRRVEILCNKNFDPISLVLGIFPEGKKFNKDRKLCLKRFKPALPRQRREREKKK